MGLRLHTSRLLEPSPCYAEVEAVSQRLIDDYGWRGAYLGLAALLVVVAVPSLLLFIPGKADKAATQASDTPTVELPGLSPGEVPPQRNELWIAAAIVIVALAAWLFIV